jgi:hypothetical protein
LDFPKLKTLTVPADIFRYDSLEPPTGQVSEFLRKHLEGLWFIEHTGFDSVSIRCSNTIPRCRVKLAQRQWTDDLDRPRHRFLLQEMETRLEIACKGALQRPIFSSAALERLTLEYSDDDVFSDRLGRLLWQMFRGGFVRFKIKLGSLHTLICRFEHPEHRNERDSDKHLLNMLAVLEVIAGLCGPSLQHLSGLLPPMRIPEDKLAWALSMFPNLKTLGVYKVTMGSAEGVKEYCMRLKRHCPKLARVELFQRVMDDTREEHRGGLCFAVVNIDG